MPAPTPTTVDALRQYARVVVLVAPRGTGSRSFQQASHAAGTQCELIGHPILAMAELCRLDREAIGRAGDRTGERAAIFIVDRDIEDLEPLFTAIETRLPRTSIWVIQGDIVVPVRVAEPDAPAVPAAVTRRPLPTPPPSVGAPKLRFVEGAPSELEPTSASESGTEPDAGDGTSPRGSEAVTSAEIEMLLGLLDGQRHERPSTDRGGPR